MTALQPVPGLAAIATKLCGRQHPNDPASAHCRVCGIEMGATTELIDMAPSPLGRLLLEDGTAVDITGDLVVGRSPACGELTEAGTDTLTVTGRQVSRTHLRIRVAGWRLSVTDCDSTNGTYLSTRGVRGRRRVPSEEAVPLTIGDTVHFGARQALVVEPGRR